MRQKIFRTIRGRHRTLCAVAAAIAVVLPGMAAATQVILGPPDPGAEHGFDSWYHGTNGTGCIFIDSTDPATGDNDLSLGNTNADRQNLADWRSPNFALGPAAKGAEPITFSFSYELPDNVRSGDNMRVQLRFFDVTGTNFLGERNILVGSKTGDSKMSGYKKVTIRNIFAPVKAQTADIRFNANLFEPWASGTGRFDDFSVTTIPGWRWVKLLVITVLGLGLGTALVVLVMWMLRTRR